VRRSDVVISVIFCTIFLGAIFMGIDWVFVKSLKSLPELIKGFLV